MVIFGVDLEIVCGDICIDYSMFSVLVIEYIRGRGAPECIFHNKHKTLCNLFSPDLAVSCVC